MKKIIIAVCTLCSLISEAQVKQRLGTYGVETRRMKVDSALQIPTFQVGIKNGYAGFDTAQFYYNRVDSSVYVHTGTAWRLLKGSGGTGQKFGVSGEDATAAQNRAFNGAGFNWEHNSFTVYSLETFRPGGIMLFTTGGSTSGYPKTIVTQDSAKWLSEVYDVTGFSKSVIDQRADDIYITSQTGEIEIEGLNTLLQESFGNVGIGTAIPAKKFHTVGTVRHASLGTASTDTTTYKPLGIDSNGDVFPMTNWFSSGGGGSGDVTKVGTPVNNQIGIWTGDGTIEGDADATFDGLELGVGRLNSTGGDIELAGVLRISDNTIAGHTVFSPASGNLTFITSGSNIRARFYNSGASANYNLETDATGNVYFDLSATGKAYQFNAYAEDENFQINGDGAVPLFFTKASTDNIGIGTGTPNASAILDLTSTTKGLLLPRMTKAQRDAIGSPVAGLAIYQTDNTPGLRVFNGTNWMKYTEATD